MKINSTTNGQVIRGDLIHPKFNDFCRWFSGKDSVNKENGYSQAVVATNGLPLKLAKTIWPLYPILQAVGLVNKRADKLARAWYGAIWSIVYSAYRPFAPDRDGLTDEGASTPIPSLAKSLFNLNEHFRAGMGTLVTAVYSSGGIGMLWGAVSGNDDFFDRASHIYETGMFNQNQIFASMNLEVLMKRIFNPNQLPEVHLSENNLKAKVELVDSLLFIPNIIARGIATLNMFGMEVGENIHRIVSALGKFSYGTWAMRFGLLKGSKLEGGDLKLPVSTYKGAIKNADETLHDFQQVGSKIFCATLPTTSWLAAACELFGYEELSEKIFKLEGKLEKLNPMVASWCIRDTWLKWFSRSQGLDTKNSKVNADSGSILPLPGKKRYVIPAKARIQ